MEDKASPCGAVTATSRAVEVKRRSCPSIDFKLLSLVYTLFAVGSTSYQVKCSEPRYSGKNAWSLEVSGAVVKLYRDY